MSKKGIFMRTYGIDYVDSNGSVNFFIVDAESLDDAKNKARRVLIESYGLTKRNILNIEYLDWLDK